MTEIGGYFELEALVAEGQQPHRDANIQLKSGRSCLRLLSEIERPTKVYLPYWTCDAVLEALAETNTPVEFLPLNSDLEFLEPLPELGLTDRLIYINYFGLRSEYASALSSRLRERLWLDCTQAFFYRPTTPSSVTFNSARKFFGVPDGAYLYAPDPLGVIPEMDLARNSRFRVDHLILRRQGRTAEGYQVFLENEELAGGATARVSELSELLLERVDYRSAADRRRTNFRLLDTALASSNRIPRQILDLGSDSVPFCYPYLPALSIDVRTLWSRDLFVPIFWPACQTRQSSGFEFEKLLSRDLLPLPIDHRYGAPEMERILSLLNSYDR